MAGKTVAELHAMKRAGRKIVGLVVYDFPTAQIADRAGVDLLSVGDSIGVNLWGQPADCDVTLDQLLVACRAVSRGAQHALVSCDLPAAAVAEGARAAAQSARRLVEEGGAGMVKVLGEPGTVAAIAAAGVPVFAEFHGGEGVSIAELVERAKSLEAAGAALLDFRHSGPEAGAAVAKAVTVPVLGGLGGGPWLDGRLRLAHTALGYGAKWLGARADTYANTAEIALAAFKALAEDVRAGRPVKGG